MIPRPTKAVVAETVERASWIRSAFDLDRWDWDCLSVNADHGARYDRIIALLGVARATSAQDRIRTWLTPGNEANLVFL